MNDLRSLFNADIGAGSHTWFRSRDSDGVAGMVLLAAIFLIPSVGAQMTALDALLTVARAHSLSLGIVCDTKGTVLGTVALPGARDASPLASIVKQMDGYELRRRGGILVISPKAMARVTRRLLRLRLPEFKAQSSTATGLSLKLWMMVEYRMAYPHPGGFAGVLHNDDLVLLPPIDSHNADVETILSSIVKKIGRAAWVVLPPPQELTDQQPDRLWGIVQYDSAPASEPVDQLCCIVRDFIRAHDSK